MLPSNLRLESLLRIPRVVQAALVSGGVHAVLLGGLLWLAQNSIAGAGSGLALEAGLRGPVAVEDRTYLDLSPENLALPLAAEAPRPDPTPAQAVADSAQLAPDSSVARRGAPAEARAPAPDSGDGTGRAPVVAWRRDLSTLKVRLTDGATAYQPSHERTPRVDAPSSPQAIRREAVVGIGDSARLVTPLGAQTRPATALPADGEGERALDDETPASATLAEGKAAARAQGALDAEKGRKTFDIDREGVARDDRTLRAASNESHPGLMDLSSPAAAGPRDGASGHGPGQLPGATSRPGVGTAAAIRGMAEPGVTGPDEIASAAEREYQRHVQEIRRRVAKVMIFPRKLLIMLEQGETIVRFLVRADGRLGGAVQVLKSAGFEEFDLEAVAAIQRAIPFPTMARPLSVSMRIPFENPVVRSD